MYAMVSQGLIIIFRGSGVLNFAQGAIGIVAAYVFWEATQAGIAFAPSFVIGVASAAALGTLTHVLVMRPLRRASPLVRLVATLGVLTVVQSVIVVIYGTNVTIVKSQLPTTAVDLGGGLVISVDRLILLGIATLCTIGLIAIYRKTRFGLATSAVAENPRAAASLGWSPDIIAGFNWAAGSALAGVAAILIAPISQLQAVTMTSLMLASLAAALVAGFRSFGLALGAGLAIGIIETILEGDVATPGIASAVPFVIVVLWLIVTGKGLPLRHVFASRLPSVGTGRIRWIPAVIAMLLACLVIMVVSPAWQIAFASTFAFGIILLSIVVLTGYAGQISLAQYSIGGLGALVAGRLASTQDMPFVLAGLAGIAVAVPVGFLFALPALRIRGMALAIVTLGLAAAIELIVFDSPTLTGGFTGTPVHPPSLFGISLDPVTHTGRYAVFCAISYLIVAVIVGNLRRSGVGRQMLAIRTNERAAASLGISVRDVKVYAFIVASVIAAVGGILLAFEESNIVYGSFSSFVSITLLAFAVVGGVGYLLGPLVGALFAGGTLGAQLLNSLWPGLGAYVQVIGGALLLATVLQNQDGVAKSQVLIMRALGHKIRPGFKANEMDDRTIYSFSDERSPGRVQPCKLDLRNLSVSYGGVAALNNVSFSVDAGSVVGLIGPNGAGKTTLIDAVTGFVQPSSGAVELDGLDISGWDPVRRARAGISRTFQGLELFEDMTVLDNIRSACDGRDRFNWVTDLVRPARPKLPPEALEAIRQFGFSDQLHRRVEELPYGQRRLVAIARAIATRPSILLLDEPAAGLSSVESAEFAGLVRRLPDEWGIGLLIVEHDMDFVSTICDEVVVLDFGIVIAHGPAEAVFKDTSVVGAYMGKQMSADESEGASGKSIGGQQ